MSINVHERLEEMGVCARSFGTSDGFSGSKLFERLIEGGAGGTPGSKTLSDYAPAYWPSRVAETFRAVASLDDGDQGTVSVVYCDPPAPQVAQAAALRITTSALQKRLRRIHLLIEDWLRPDSREKRRLEHRERELAANLASSQARDEAIRERAKPSAEQPKGKKAAKRRRKGRAAGLVEVC